jgi:biopolymer transport protein ExbD
MKVSRSFEHKARIEMLPLIDIVFLLLVFFIYAMLSMAVHRSLPVALPSSATAAIDPSADISLTVQADGSVFVNQTPVPLERLSSFLQQRTENSKEKGVLVFADRSLAYQSLFQVLDQIRLAGIERVSLQAEKDD